MPNCGFCGISANQGTLSSAMAESKIAQRAVTLLAKWGRMTYAMAPCDLYTIHCVCRMLRQRATAANGFHEWLMRHELHLWSLPIRLLKHTWSITHHISYEFSSKAFSKSILPSQEAIHLHFCCTVSASNHFILVILIYSATKH